MEDYIYILLEYISQERLSTMSRKHIAYLAQEEDAFTALSRTFTEEQKKLFLVYEDARNACAGASEDAYARQAFLLAKEIFH